MNSDLLTISDFRVVGIMTAHCNRDKLNTAINFARTFKMDELLCYGFMADIVEKWGILNALPAGEPIPEELVRYKTLIDGGEFPDCNGKTKYQQGIRSLWVHYAYAEYVKINQLDDTPNGLKFKNNEFSVQPTLGEVNTFSFKYDNMAKAIYQNIKEYLCINKDIFTKFDDCDCDLSCGCSGSCSCGKVKKVTGFRFKSVKKRP